MIVAHSLFSNAKLRCLVSWRVHRAEAKRGQQGGQISLNYIKQNRHPLENESGLLRWLFRSL